MVDAITAMDAETISAEKAELLRNEFMPTPEEVELINERVESGYEFSHLVFLDSVIKI